MIQFGRNHINLISYNLIKITLTFFFFQVKGLLKQLRKWAQSSSTLGPLQFSSFFVRIS